MKKMSSITKLFVVLLVIVGAFSVAYKIGSSNAEASFVIGTTLLPIVLTVLFISLIIRFVYLFIRKLQNASADRNEKFVDEKLEQLNISSAMVSEKALMTVNEAAVYSNLDLQRIQELCQEPNCPFSVKNGNRFLIKREAFDEWLKNVKEI